MKLLFYKIFRTFLILTCVTAFYGENLSQYLQAQEIAPIQVVKKKKKKTFFRKKTNSNNIKLRIDQPISEDYPEMEVYITVSDKKNNPVLSLVKENFQVYIDGEEIPGALEVSGFQYNDDGVAYSLIISGNGMMDGEPFEQQLNAAIILLEAMRENDTFSLYVFGEEVNTVFEFEGKDESLLDKISKTKISGGNPHLYDALVYTCRRFDKSSKKRKVLIVLSDGRENGSRYTKEQLYKIIDEKNFPIYSIGLKLMAGQNLHRIADLSNHSGGEYLFSGDLSNIPKSMKTLINQVKMGYVIKFRSTDKIPPDNQIHQLHVKATSERSTTSFFKNFVATKVPISFWIKLILIILSVIALVVVIILMLIHQKKMRKAMGITSRKCPVCKSRLKDDWDECIFCKYLPPKRKKLKSK